MTSIKEVKQSKKKKEKKNKTKQYFVGVEVYSNMEKKNKNQQDLG